MQKVVEEWSFAIPGATPEVKLYIDRSAGSDLLSSLCKYVQETFGRGRLEAEHKRIPLFVTPVPSARKNAGLNIPSEFVLDALDLPSLSMRVCQLQLVHATGIERAFLRAMCVGAFRKYLFLDDENHGQGEMDFSELTNLKPHNFARWTNKHGQPWATVVMDRIYEICDNPVPPAQSRSLQAECYRLLFLKETGAIKKVMQDIIELSGSSIGVFQS